MKPAIETHEMLYQVMQRHSFLPEVTNQQSVIYNHSIILLQIIGKEQGICPFFQLKFPFLWTINIKSSYSLKFDIIFTENWILPWLCLHI